MLSGAHGAVGPLGQLAREVIGARQKVGVAHLPLAGLFAIRRGDAAARGTARQPRRDTRAKTMTRHQTDTGSRARTEHHDHKTPGNTKHLKFLVLAWQVLPGGQAEYGTPDSMLVEQVRNRVREIRAGQGQEIRGRRLNDAPQGKLVGDDERDWYFPHQEPGQRLGVAAQRVKQTFAVGQPVTSGVLGRVPLTVGSLFSGLAQAFADWAESHSAPGLTRSG